MDGVGRVRGGVPFDRLEPLSPERLALVCDFPVAVYEPLALGGREVGKLLQVVVEIEVGGVAADDWPSAVTKRSRRDS